MDDPKEIIKAKEKGPVEWLDFLQDFTDKLTISRIFTALLTGLLLTVTTMLYENRDTIFQKIYTASASVSNDTPSNWVVSKQTTDELTSFVNTTPLINFAMITEIDLKKNRRIPKFWFFKGAQLNLVKSRLGAMLPQSAFDYDPKNTQQMVSILNNEFVCSKFSETSYQRVFPEMAKAMPTICGIAVPPFYGRFAGVLTIGLSAQPTKNEIDSIRLEASRLAVEIYLRDIIKKPLPDVK